MLGQGEGRIERTKGIVIIWVRRYRHQVALWRNVYLDDVWREVVCVLSEVFPSHLVVLDLSVHGDRYHATLIKVDDVPNAWATREEKTAGGVESLFRWQHWEERRAGIDAKLSW